MEFDSVQNLSKHQDLFHHREDLIDIKSEWKSCLNDADSEVQEVETIQTHILEDLENYREALIAEINEKINDVKADVDGKCAQEKKDLEKYKTDVNQNIEEIDGLLNRADSELQTVSDQEKASREYRQDLVKRIMNVPEIQKLGQPIELALEKNMK